MKLFRLNPDLEVRLIGCGHFAADLAPGSLPAILALLYHEGVLGSYGDVAMLVMASTVLNALLQPLCGILADRRPRPYLMGLGMLLSAGGIMFTGLCTEASVLLWLLVGIGGAGQAVFHPAAGKLANLFAGRRTGRGMSVYSVGGNIGFALGPVVMSVLYMAVGIRGTLFLCLPALVMITVFALRQREYRILTGRDSRRQERRAGSGRARNYRGMLALGVLIFLRSTVWQGMMSFLPLYFLHNLHLDASFSTMTNGIVCACGAVATYLGGSLGDRAGYTRLLWLSSLFCLPFLLLFCLADTPLPALCALIPFTMSFYLAMSTIVVAGQKYMPHDVGLATGITVGLNVSIGGLMSPAMGAIGDSFGLGAVMYAALGLMTLAALSCLFLPRLKGTGAGAQSDRLPVKNGHGLAPAAGRAMLPR